MCENVIPSEKVNCFYSLDKYAKQGQDQRGKKAEGTFSISSQESKVQVGEHD